MDPSRQGADGTFQTDEDRFSVCASADGLDAELRALIRRMDAKIPLLGAPRIRGELLTLGVEIAQSSRREVHGQRLATNDLGARGAGRAATVCLPVIAARRPISVHSFGEPCWISGWSSHQFWRGMSSGSGTCSPYDIR